MFGGSNEKLEFDDTWAWVEPGAARLAPVGPSIAMPTVFQSAAQRKLACVATPAERKALNQGTFRKANEDLDEGARKLLGREHSSFVPFLCECPDPACREVLLVTLREYEGVRARPERGVAAIGHEDLDIERVVARNDRFVVTEKFGAAGEVHRETYPRE